MIKKKGNKTDRTVMMENAVYRLFKNKGIELFPEFRLNNGNIADFCSIKYDENGTLEETIIVEVKQSVADFYSTHGLNFVGLRNYIAVPSELLGRTIMFLREELQNVYIGIIEVDVSGKAQIIMESRYLWKNLWKPFPEISGYRIAVELAETYEVDLSRILAATDYNMISSKKSRRGLIYVKEADLLKYLPTEKAYKDRILERFEEMFSDDQPPFKNCTLKEIEKALGYKIDIRKKGVWYL